MEQIVYYILFFLAGALLVWLAFRQKKQPVSQNDLSHNVENASSSHENTDEKNEETIPETDQHLRSRLDTLLLVNDLSRKVTSSLNLDQAFTHLYTVVNSLMDASVMELEVKYGNPNENIFLTNLSGFEKSGYSNPFAEWCFRNHRTVFLNDAQQHYARYVFEPLIMPDGRAVNSVMSFPLKNNDDIIGVFTVMSFNKNAFEEFHAEMVGYLNPFIAASIKNAFYHKELNSLKLRAEKSEDFMKQFLANMSHEIRTPIHAITGMTQLLINKSPREEQIKYLNNISNASETLLSIINDILDLSKIEAGRMDIEEIPFAFAETIGKTHNMMLIKAEEKGLQLEMKIDPAIAPVLIGDPVRITQVLFNLLGNAIKFTHSGKILLTVDLNLPVDQEEGSVNYNELFFSVSDTGIGMTEEQLRKIFLKYTQAHTSTSRRYGGTGLGLSIASQLVTLMGGTLGATSKKDEGSTFYFSLKLKQAQPDLQLINQSNLLKDQITLPDNLRILIVDDNDYNRMFANDSIRSHSPSTIIDEAENGANAIKLIKTNKYDIILMDVIMPDINGYETTNMIRNDLGLKSENLPVVALTASLTNEVIEKCKVAGMNAFLAKPFKSEQLLNVISEALNSTFKENNSRIRMSRTGSGETTNIINIDHLNEYLDYDDERILRYLQRFQKQVPASIRSLRSFIDNKEFENARVVAHSLKPLLKVLGIEAGYDLVSEMEQLCITKPTSNLIEPIFKELEAVCSEALKEVKNCVSQKQRAR